MSVLLNRRRALAVAVALAVFGPSATAAEPSPESVVRELSDALLGAMRIEGDDAFVRRRERLEPIIRARFDLAFIAGAVLGRHAATLDESGRARFNTTFARLVVNTYAARFKGYSGHTIEVVDQRPMRAGRQLVRTRLAAPEDSGTTLDYLLQKSDGEWKIVNVVSGGVSDLSLRRAEYGAIIASDGFESLLEQLERQALAYEQG